MQEGGPAPLDFQNFKVTTEQRRKEEQKIGSAKPKLEGTEVPKRVLYQGTERVGPIEQPKAAPTPEINRSRVGKILDFALRRRTPEQAEQVKPPEFKMKTAKEYVAEYISNRPELNNTLAEIVAKVTLNGGNFETNSANLRKRLEDDLEKKLILHRKEVSAGRTPNAPEFQKLIEKGIESSLNVIMEEKSIQETQDALKQAQKETAAAKARSEAIAKAVKNARDIADGLPAQQEQPPQRKAG